MSTFFKILKFNNTLLFLILIFFLTRFLFFIFGLSADPGHLPHMWQLLNPQLLKDDFFKSLLFLHFQPPLWNFIFGIFVKLFGTDYETLNIVLNLFNLFISILITLYFYFICRHFNLTNFKIYLFFFIFIGFSPSLLMYENFIHYTNLTVLFFLIISFYLIKFGEEQNIKNELKVYIPLILLIYTWSIFNQPLVLIVVSAILLSIRKNKKFISFVLFIIIFFISLLPSLKNKYLFNHFSSTYGPGIQLMQVLVRYDYEYPLCSFNLVGVTEHEKKFLQENNKVNFSHPSFIGELSKYNSVAFIYRTKKCLPVAINLIKENPMNYINKVKFNLISSHGHFAFDFGQKPKSWNKIFGFFDDLKLNKFTNKIKVRSLQLYHLIFHLFFIILILRLIFNYKKRTNLDLPIACVYFLYAWIIFISHMGAGFEFERMRHTGHALHIIFFIILIKKNFNLFLNRKLI